MYKIITDRTQLETINNAAKSIENNPDSNYDLGQKNCTLEKWAILLSSWLEKQEVKELCPFITNEWLNSDISVELSSDWAWHYDEPIRIIIPNDLILREPCLKALISYCDANEVLNITPESETMSYVYVKFIHPEHQDLFDLFPEIKIETK
jgi:hypothetical protein